MKKQLHWVKEAFSRDVILMEGERVVGGMHRDLLAWDVDAYLNDIKVRFDVKGFLVHAVNLHDLTDNNQILGHIKFNWFRSATLTCSSGETYTWKSEHFMMGQWSLLAGDPNSKTDQEIIHYDRTRAFLTDAGTIELVQDSPHTDLLILTGLFVRNYFLRKRKIASIH